jgi:8-oxo-dGTP diphosphatase
MEMSDRLYPQRPLSAASIAVFRDGKVLLAARKETTVNPVFSLPGGLVEIGETLEDAALRELKEEVGVEARVTGFVDHLEYIERDDADTVRRHFIIHAFVGIWLSGEAMTGPEAPHVLWAEPDALGGLATTKGLGAIVRKAHALLSR